MEKQTLKRAINPNEKKEEYGKIKRRVVEYINNNDVRISFTPCTERDYYGEARFEKVLIDGKFEGVVRCNNKSCGDDQVYCFIYYDSKYLS